jgi:peptide deformylase
VTINAIRMLGDPVLRTKARDVDTFDAALARLADELFETMYDAPGVGLAAPQVGLSIRLFVYDSAQGDRGVVANPELSELEGEQEGDEGCLSVPGLYYPTRRYDRVRLDGVDVHGQPLTLHGEGYFARILQHETDHTNGLLYLDRLDRGERKQAMADLRQRELAPSPGRLPRQL